MKKLSLLFAVVFVLSMLLTACGPSSSSASCTYIVGNGVYDRNIKAIVYPGQTMPTSMDNTTTKVAPCGYRNYIITDGSVEGLGDRPNPSIATLPSGTQLEVLSSAFWMLNQGDAEMREFYKFADKYDALNETDDKAGNVNASTPGWNLMLKENFGPTLDAIVKQSIYNINNDWDSIKNEKRVHEQKITDEIWKTEDQLQIKELENEMTYLFKEDIRKRIGTDLDLFCSSGSQSGWTDSDPAQAGQPGNKFECAPVRVEVNTVRRAVSQGDTGSQGIIDANRQRYDAAKELYGDQTECWLGIQDAIKAGAGSDVPLVINIDAGSCNPNNPDGSEKPTQIVFPNPPTPIANEATAPVEPTAVP